MLDLADKRRAVKMKKNNNPEDEELKQLYSQLKTEIDIKIEKCRNDCYNKHCCEAEEASRRNDMRTLFQKVKTLKKTDKTSIKCANVREKNDKLLTKETDILKRWHEYSMGLYNANIATDDDATDQLWPNCEMNEQEPCILESEVKAAISKIKARKAPGVDGIEGKLILGGGQTIVQIMHKLCNRIWNTGEFLELWTKSIIVTIPKKGDATKCENYRTISLICHASKIILEIIRT